MADSDVQSLKDRLMAIEITMHEKWEHHDKRSDEIWESHNKRSDERWADLMEKMHELSHKTTPCQEHIKIMAEFEQRMSSLEKKVSFIETSAWASIGIVLISALIISLIKHISI